MSDKTVTFNGFSFADLFSITTLETLDQQFLQQVQQHDAKLHDQLLAYRAKQPLTPLEISNLLLACAPLLDSFIIDLFSIQREAEKAQVDTLSHDKVFDFKKWFVQRRARRRLSKRKEITESFAALDAWLVQQLSAHAIEAENDREAAVAALGAIFLQDKEKFDTDIEQLTRWCVLAMSDADGQAAVQGWTSFKIPNRLDHQQLVPIIPVAGDKLQRIEGPLESRYQREGFALTDMRMNAREVQNEVRYCIYCHDHEGDFCSKGFPNKKGDPSQGLKIDPLGVTLTGCPLDEKISEMHSLKRDGYSISALAMIMVDNPMCAATGHRICNDCMKGCIYQKQDPVNIPQIETRVLTDVLALPWGVEIYDLLTRWNPLRQHQYLPRHYNGLKVLIAGQGPAGFTLAHHLLMEGFAVVGVEGLKIEPLSQDWVHTPIRDYSNLEESLDSRVMAGFGGVAEYGITVRWDKNFLRLIYLSLLRRPHYQIFGSVRFGGTVTVEDAWALGFDHVAIAVGAGLPQALPIPGSLAPGMRQANDFLMALQLTGAAKADSLATLQVRLPAVVIGGGLTGVDTATEVQAYYLVQIEKTLNRYEKLAETIGEARLREQLDDTSLDALQEFLSHGRILRAEKARAAATGEPADVQRLLREWGGVTIAYRRTMQESPAYTRNHEELSKALEEGLYYLEGVEPKAVQRDDYGHASGLICRRREKDENGDWQVVAEEIIVPARSIFVATGAKPNVAYSFEHANTLERDKKKVFQYLLFNDQDGKLQETDVVEHCKIEDFGPFTSYQINGRRVSFIGDTHPVFHGSVVKAIASGLRTYPHIANLFRDQLNQPGDETDYQRFREHMNDLFQATVEKVIRHCPTVVELQVRAPMAARKFRPGQFFRVQNFETLSPVLEGTRLQTEALAMLGAGVDQDAGLISMMVLEKGVSSRLCATLQPGQPLSVMGPTGVRTTIPKKPQTMMVIGGRLGAADIRAIGPTWREAGHRVLYIAGFQNADEVYCQADLEAAADVIVWVTEHGEPVTPRRPQDRAATGQIIDIIAQYAAGGVFGPPIIPLSEVSWVSVIGTSRLLRMVRDAKKGVLAPFFTQQPQFFTSIHSTMQCMLKGVCAQCLQWQIDPQTGQRTKAVFACSWQDQPMDMVDIDNLDERLAQNRLQEHLNNLWLDYLLARHSVERV